MPSAFMYIAINIIPTISVTVANLSVCLYSTAIIFVMVLVIKYSIVLTTMAIIEIAINSIDMQNINVIILIH